MPHLRFSRDKRGYENTFVVHAGRRRGKGRSRILYWFRTPPGVRVGRSALDEDAIRLIEEHNPDVEFDWTRILKGGTEPKDLEEERQPRPARPEHVAQRASALRTTPGKPGSLQDQTHLRASGYGGQAGVDSAGVKPDFPVRSPVRSSSPDFAPVSDEFDPLLAAGDPAIDPFDDEEDPLVTAPGPLELPTAALARLGSEGLSRLRARHAEVLARITERVPDAQRRDELKSQAERLNPDTWVTDAEVTTGLEQYEAVFEAIRAVVGRKRRRRKRRGANGDRTAASNGTGTDEPGRRPEGEESSDPDDPGSDDSV